MLSDRVPNRGLTSPPQVKPPPRRWLGGLLGFVCGLVLSPFVVLLLKAGYYLVALGAFPEQIPVSCMDIIWWLVGALLGSEIGKRMEKSFQEKAAIRKKLAELNKESPKE